MTYLGVTGKEPTCQCRRCKRSGFDPWIGEIPWRRKWQCTPVFLPRESHGQRSLLGYGPWGHKESDKTAVMAQRARELGWSTATAARHITTRSASFLHSKRSSSTDSYFCRWHNMPLGASQGFACSLESSSTTLKGATMESQCDFYKIPCICPPHHHSQILTSFLIAESESEPFPNYDLFPNS